MQSSDPLDPTKVDLSTLSLGVITFGTHVITLPANTSDFNTVVSVSSSLSVRTQGSLDGNTNTLKWTFTSIDPTTGLPPSDPTVGFLPPDADGVEGQGSVTFSVTPKPGQTTGTQITNQASVVFYTSAPINTATWLNTLDVNPPHSSVTALPAQESQSTFNVAWSGTDVGSGIGAYSIYVSDNGAPFTVFQNSVTTTSASFTGQAGHTYGFYSRAVDAAGNVEASKSVADTTTSVAGGSANPTTTTGVSVSIAFSPSPQMITLYALVTSTGGTVNAGTVRFTLLGTTVQGAVSSGSASASFTVPASEAVGNYTILEVYSGATGFAGGSDNTKQLSIGKAAPVVTWPAPAAIQAGSTLGGGQLDATANIPGTFVYNPPAGTVLSAGNNQTLAVTFTPADSLDCGSANASVTISVLVPSGGGFSAIPGSGSIVHQVFSYTFTNSGGWQNLGVMDVLINNAINGIHACYVAYVPSSATSGSLFLVDNTGDAGGPYAGMVLPGNGSVQNRQCSISGTGSSVAANGNTLTLTLDVTLSAAFAGNRITYMAAQGNGPGWQAMGTWNVPGGAAPIGPAVSGMSPARSTTATQTYTFTFTDTNGWQDIGVTNILVNSAIDGRHACYVASVPSSASGGSLFLVDDAGDGGGPYSGMVLPGSSTMQNSQCTINATGSSVTANGNTLTLTLAMSFSQAFAGNQIFFAAARNNTLNSNWQSIGTVSIP